MSLIIIQIKTITVRKFRSSPPENTDGCREVVISEVAPAFTSTLSKARCIFLTKSKV
jgi:hypothetical protein